MSRLEKPEISLEQFFSVSLDMLCVANRDGYFKRVNQAFTDVLGYPASAFYEKPIVEFLHPEDVARTQAVFSYAASKPMGLEFENRYRAQDGSYRYLSWRFSFQEDLIYASARDISDYKKLALESERFFRTSLDLLAISDTGGHFTRVNPIVEQILGYTPEEFCKIPYLELIHPDDVQRTADAVKNQVGGSEVLNFENRYLCKDGSFKWISWKSSSIGDTMYGCGRDVTAEYDLRAQASQLNRDLELRVAERTRQLEETAKRFERVVSSNMIGIFFWNVNGQITESNQAFLDMVGYTRHELLSGEVNWMEMTPREFDEIDRKGLKDFAELGICKPYEKEYFKKDGSRLSIYIGYATLEGSEKEGVCFVLDRSDVKKAETERNALSVSQKSAIESSKLKSEFLANMSHEIRTPINGVLGMVGLLMDTPLQSEQREYVEAAKASADTLLTVINDILDFSKVEAVKLEFETIDFELPKLFEEVEKSFLYLARAKSIAMIFEVDPSVVGFVRGDPGRVRQILNNLMSNAIKFTAKGIIRVSVKPDTDKNTDLGLNRENYIRVEVTDTGVGISSAVQPRMFQAFSQADATTTRRYGGSGLGLSISKHLVEQMNGSIGVVSKENEGSTFWFTLELKPAEGAVPSSPHSVKSADSFAGFWNRPVRVLVAEDNAINQKIALKMLEKMGLRADAVANGREALDSINRVPYDLILMDCQMPELDGYETTRQIRHDPDSKAHLLPIIAMTANAMNGERERCLAAGMSDYLSKPAQYNELFEVLSRWLPAKST